MDSWGRGQKRRQLTGLAAEVASVKEANDLGGKVLVFLPYIPGMALGISNGNPGTLVSIIYEEIDRRRYAISAEVDFRAYKNSNANAPHPLRVTLKTMVCPRSTYSTIRSTGCKQRKLAIRSRYMHSEFLLA
ncbi:hypothetical protein C8J57DRAFT_1437267 [Mycena rebaudengoi]|nr:hypothetical protein C8J57DRAFT_1438263 [Mycena rebaudengoi]KAJ7253861.1 hypothetical protein C8J57DRAFT_1437267 [Mycena rebaudengoi]